MIVLKNGQKSHRTSIQAGDRIIIDLASNPGIIFSVFRKDEGQLYFEVIEDNKCLMIEFPPQKAKADNFIFLLCQITGLRARLIQEDRHSMFYMMEEGNEIFALQ